MYVLYRQPPHPHIGLNVYTCEWVATLQQAVTLLTDVPLYTYEQQWTSVFPWSHYRWLLCVLWMAVCWLLLDVVKMCEIHVLTLLWTMIDSPYRCLYHKLISRWVPAGCHYTLQTLYHQQVVWQCTQFSCQLGVSLVMMYTAGNDCL